MFDDLMKEIGSVYSKPSDLRKRIDETFLPTYNPFSDWYDPGKVEKEDKENNEETRSSY